MDKEKWDEEKLKEQVECGVDVGMRLHKVLHESGCSLSQTISISMRLIEISIRTMLDDGLPLSSAKSLLDGVGSQIYKMILKNKNRL